MDARNRGGNTTDGAHSLVGERQRNKRTQIPFQTALKACVGKILHNTTETEGKEVVLRRAQEKSL